MVLVQHQSRGVLATKVAMRLAVLPTDRPARVLDCFAGDHDIWDTAQDVASQPIEVLHNDADPRYCSRLAMAAVDVLRPLDLDGFDLIDLDAWRPPYDELSVICEREYGGVVAYTSIVKNAPAERWMVFLEVCGWERSHIVHTQGPKRCAPLRRVRPQRAVRRRSIRELLPGSPAVAAAGADVPAITRLVDVDPSERA